MAAHASARNLQFLLLAFAIPICAGFYFDTADVALKLKCACGCKESMTVCSHQGCMVAPKMRAQFKTLLASGAGEDAILKRFVQDYGDAALADQSAASAGPIALFVPFAVLLLAIPTLVIVLRRWRNRNASAKHESV